MEAIKNTSKIAVRKRMKKIKIKEAEVAKMLAELANEADRGTLDMQQISQRARAIKGILEL